ncbi:MAG: outer membrane beta-barrel protein [Bacteroidetes bacterium]|nr:outer membrane beta-barrel protein [Bacteroidota bacterium]
MCKKLICLFGAVMFAISPLFVAAQSPSFNIKGGLNLSNMTFDGPVADGTSASMATGFHLGAFVELPLNGKFGLETGLLLQSKGFKSPFTSSFFNEEIMDTVSYGGDQQTTLLYLDIPIQFKGRFSLGGINLIAAAGPYFGFGLSGTRLFEYTIGSDFYEEEQVIDYGDNGDFVGVDYGVMGTVGIEFSNVFLAATYAQGLANISTFEPDQNTIRHQNIMISLGFRLGVD